LICGLTRCTLSGKSCFDAHQPRTNNPKPETEPIIIDSFFIILIILDFQRKGQKKILEFIKIAAKDLDIRAIRLEV
jgi:hypothetical protein